MIQHTARPESAAPMVKAETADATRRLRETRLSGSINKLCCRIPTELRHANKKELFSANYILRVQSKTIIIITLPLQ